MFFPNINTSQFKTQGQDVMIDGLLLASEQQTFENGNIVIGQYKQTEMTYLYLYWFVCVSLTCQAISMIVGISRSWLWVGISNHYFPMLLE